MIRSNNINKYYSLENCYIKINPIKSNDKIEYQCFEISKRFSYPEGEPLTKEITYTEESLISILESDRKKRKCYISEILHIKKG